MSQEIEIRFAVRPDDLARLARTTALGGIAAGRPATRRLSTIYYDTRELRFAKAGLSLRVRKTGRGYVQTVKNENSGMLASERGEFECKLPSPSPDLRFVSDPDLRERLQTIANDAAVEPVIETEIRRTTRSLTTEAGDEIELALDRGEIRTLGNGGAILPVNEMELELKQGTSAALYDVARKISREAPLTVALESKSERGLRALEGRNISARKAGRTEFAPDATAEEAFRATLSHCLRHIARNASAVADARDPEGVHQMRVGLRRFRAALAAFGDMAATGALADLRARAQTLSDTFAKTRELDVFALDLLTPVERASQKPGLAQLRQALEELRAASWNDSVALVRSDAFTGFLLDLAAAIETRSWREGASADQLIELLLPARTLAIAALESRLKKTAKRAKHLSRLDITERHRLRIALKKLRYGIEFFAPLFEPKSVSAFLERLTRLQDLFGALNDAAMVEHILARIAEHAGDHETPELSEAAAFCDGWHQSHIPATWKKAKKRWRRFVKTEPFWVA